MAERARILLAEDDETMRRAVRAILERAVSPMPHVDEAASGEEALLLLRSHPYALVMADQYMERVSGIDLLEAARQEQPIARRILLTGRADVDLAAEAIDRARLHGFVTKAADPRALQSRIAAAVGRALSEPLM